MKKTSGITNRPGGFLITDRALSFCSFKAGAKILDLGCGCGATVDYMIQTYGFNAYGLDKNPELTYNPNNLIKSTAEEISFPEASMDGVLMECSFSVMDNQAAVLKESRRVLKADGRLIISDMYAHGDPAQLDGCLGGIETKENLISLLESNGFRLELFEDFSHQLKTMWGQMIFKEGAKSFYSNLGADTETMRRIKCGYCLIIGRKKDAE
jgi:ubiquinone/menaquinone biosynthesis C-methylase UbiE